MRAIRVDLDELAFALETSDPEAYSYVDTETGEVIFITDEWLLPVKRFLEKSDAGSNDPASDFEAWLRSDSTMVDEDILRSAFSILTNESRYLEVPAADSQDGFRDMQDFAESVEDERAQEFLFFALSGPKPFRRFKDALERYPDERESWFAFRDERLRQRALDWLESEGLSVETSTQD